MKTSFAPISIDDYIQLHTRNNPGVDRDALRERLNYAISAHNKGVRCQCGAPIWIIGSAAVGLSCVTCITGEFEPENDYEIDISEPPRS